MDSVKTPKKRRGKVVKPKRGEAAFFVLGAPVQFDAEAIAEKLHLWWKAGDGRSFIIGENPRAEGSSPQTWSKWPENKILSLLAVSSVMTSPRVGEAVSEAERVLLHVMQRRRLARVVSALGGYPAGIYEAGGAHMLVQAGPRLIDPKQGDWSTVRALIHSKLDFGWGDDEGHGIDQTPYFHGWMKTALESLYLGKPGNFRPGQCCIFAGPRNSGKSRLQHQVITGLLGGRCADPGPYLFGRTDFNADILAAEHLLMEDPAAPAKQADRNFFGESLKQMVVNDTQRLHAKGQDATAAAPFSRTTISINDDPDKLRVLPMMTPDLKDKVSLFLVSPHPLPMPTVTLAEREAFRSRMAAELPAYAWYLLNEHKIEEHHASERFGVREWHHPELAVQLFEDTPAAELLCMIDLGEFRYSAATEGPSLKLWELKSRAEEAADEWEDSASDLERLLLSETHLRFSLEHQAKRLLAKNKLTRLLARLKEDAPERVTQCRSNMERRWRIRRPV